MFNPEVVLNSFINQTFEIKKVQSPLNASLTKPASSKTMLRHLMTATPLNRNRDSKTLTQDSTSNHKTHIESSVKEHSYIKRHPSTEVASHEKNTENSKTNSKLHQPKVGSLKKHVSYKPKMLQINTEDSIYQNPDLLHSIKPSSVKNILRLDSSKSPQPRRISFGKENKLNLSDLTSIFPQSVKNASSKTFDLLNNSKLAPVSCTNKAMTQITHYTLPDDTSYPPRSKHKNERIDDANDTGFSNIRFLDKRRSSIRNRRCANIIEVLDEPDEPISKLSTKAPSQFSDLRSFPSQKSQSIYKHDTPEKTQDNQKSTILSHKENQNQETRTQGSGGDSNDLRHKRPVLKDITNNSYILDRKSTKPNVLANLDFSGMHVKDKDRSSFGVYLRSLQDQKKMESSMVQKVLATHKNSKEVNIYNPGKEDEANLSIIKRKSVKKCENKENKENECPQKKKLERRNTEKHVKPLVHLKVPINIRNNMHSEGSDDREIRLNFLSCMPVTENTNERDSQNKRERSEIQKILTTMIKNNHIDEIKTNPKAKFLQLRKQIQERRATRDTRSVDTRSFNENGKHKSPKICLKIKARRETDFSLPPGAPSVESNSKSFHGIFQRTKQMLEKYQEKEKVWMKEKKFLLTKIETLEKKLVEDS